jgi:phospholipase/carboxylesterase
MDSHTKLLMKKVRRSLINIAAPPLLVMLHGEGGDEEEVFDLLEGVDDRFVLVSLRAPFVQEGKKYLWYTTTRFHDEYLANPAQLEFSRQQIINAIQHVKIKYHCNHDQVYIFGFGQGGVMSVNLLLTMPVMINGIAVLNSQFLPEFRALIPADDVLRNNAILICHGKYNQIIPVDLGRKLKYELSRFSSDIDYQEFDIGHYYSKDIITTIGDWLTVHLDNANVQMYPIQDDYSVNLIAYQINVSDIDQSINFYTRFLGMRLVEKTGKTYAFLSNNLAHHVISLQLSERGQKSTSGTLLGYHSIQFEVPDKLSFAKVYWNLIEARINVSTVDRIICWLMKFSDPDGNVIEIIWDTRHLQDRSDVWYGRELPLEKDKILEILIKP